MPPVIVVLHQEQELVGPAVEAGDAGAGLVQGRISVVGRGEQDDVALIALAQLLEQLVADLLCPAADELRMEQADQQDARPGRRRGHGGAHGGGAGPAGQARGQAPQPGACITRLSGRWRGRLRRPQPRVTAAGWLGVRPMS